MTSLCRDDRDSFLQRRAGGTWLDSLPKSASGLKENLNPRKQTMNRATSRGATWALALTLTAVAACGDDAPTTAPHAAARSTAVNTNSVILVTNTSGSNVPGSLLWAVSQTDGGSVIQFDPSIAGDTIALESTLEAYSVLNIEGPATKGITITSASGRVIRAQMGGTLRNVTISGGSEGSGSGSGIWTGGPLVLEHSTVSNNTGDGGAIHGFDITLRNSTVSNNTGYGPAAGISYGSGARVRLFNSTVAFNSPAPGIGMVVGSPGGAADVMVQNSIIAGNGFGLDCGAVSGVVWAGRNIAGDSSCGSPSEGLIVADPGLTVLADNGGPTQTIRFDPRGPALNGTLGCMVTVDQRYVPRDAICDIGAFEFTNFTVVTLTVDASAVTGAPNGLTTVTGTVSCSRPGDQFGVVVDLEQTQKVGRTTTVVRGSGTFAVTCSTTPQPWGAAIEPLDGGVFATGAASVTARTTNTAAWVTPADTSRSIKLVRPPRR
jgi:hypothetical protein